MGAGSSLEAAFPLRRALPAGPWGLIGDGLLLGDMVTAVDVRFEVLWRKQGAPATDGTVLATFEHHYVRDTSKPFNAIAYSATQTGLAAAEARAGDSLVLRVTVLGGDPDALFVPNGDGSTTQGRIPRLDLPQ